jgi:hypothetical protein
LKVKSSEKKKIRSPSGRAEYTFAHHDDESVVGTVLACAVGLRPLHFGAEEVSRGTVAGGIYIIVFVIVAHFDPIGMGIEMVASCNGKRKYSREVNGTVRQIELRQIERGDS